MRVNSCLRLVHGVVGYRRKVAANFDVSERIFRPMCIRGLGLRNMQS